VTERLNVFGKLKKIMSRWQIFKTENLINKIIFAKTLIYWWRCKEGQIQKAISFFNQQISNWVSLGTKHDDIRHLQNNFFTECPLDFLQNDAI